ncbi:putative TetR-family transcriptional regulator [Actinoplanes missouriensis 431]|uniref:Putative TetR-family transcriptional regulator n=1 Tax=Actinoplanes missouriensis (strain ATCC 14538 / DSM 43046 / CBS 188.64 / JCM 3121 / NBRC 102363 / NCIMB 12654 / NRRL B-3342 / UNCC 431) TaxID=512565 RepID=I0H4I3_ACTM4|nr:TetR family transcriptional regulator [Actinoplanes missouriensis]BAL87920.1 putative TetR-family transcriptional regulator [Actinoplanes missouriensis 431]
MGRTAGRGPEDTKRLILDAARSVVVAQGARATMDDVAAAVGLTRGAVIYHYSSKNALWIALVRDMIAQFRQAVQDRLEDGPAPGRLARAYIRASLEGDEIEAVGERLFLLAALGVTPGVPEIAAEDGARWKADMADDGLSLGARTVILNAVDGAGLMTGWGLKPDRAELAALRFELEKLTVTAS